jgi:hypothetical protein
MAGGMTFPCFSFFPFSGRAREETSLKFLKGGSFQTPHSSFTPGSCILCPFFLQCCTHIRVEVLKPLTGLYRPKKRAEHQGLSTLCCLLLISIFF